MVSLLECLPRFTTLVLEGAMELREPFHETGLRHAAAGSHRARSSHAWCEERHREMDRRPAGPASSVTVMRPGGTTHAAPSIRTLT